MSEDRLETLNETLSRQAAEWTTQDLEAIVAGMRSIREQWNTAQAVGSRKLVRSSSITKKPVKFAGLTANLSKVKV
jgi:hypothetical protein